MVARSTSGERVLRRLGDRAQGERHRVRRAGTVDGVEVSLWSSGDVGQARLDVYRRCGDVDVLLRTVRVDVSEIGLYDGVRSPMEPQTFRLDVPVVLMEGDVLDVVVAAESGAVLVLGIHQGNPYRDGDSISQLAAEVPDVFEEGLRWEDAAVTLLVH